MCALCVNMCDLCVTYVTLMDLCANVCDLCVTYVLPTRLPACPPARLPVCPPARLPACPPARLLMSVCPPARLPVCCCRCRCHLKLFYFGSPYHESSSCKKLKMMRLGSSPNIMLVAWIAARCNNLRRQSLQLLAPTIQQCSGRQLGKARCRKQSWHRRRLPSHRRHGGTRHRRHTRHSTDLGGMPAK